LQTINVYFVHDFTITMMIVIIMNNKPKERYQQIVTGSNVWGSDVVCKEDERDENVVEMTAMCRQKYHRHLALNTVTHNT